METVLLNSDKEYFDYCVLNTIGDISRQYASQYSDVGHETGIECDYWHESDDSCTLRVTRKPKTYPCVLVWRCWEGDHDSYDGEFVYLEDLLQTKNQENMEIDNVNHPSHYTWLKNECGIEVIDIVRHLDFCRGNAIKYILRAGRKESAGKTSLEKEIEDLRKAQWYISDLISQLEKQKEKEKQDADIGGLSVS